MPIIIFLYFYSGFHVNGKEKSAEEEFLNGRFPECLKILKKIDPKKFSYEEKILFLEVLIRNGEHQKAVKLISNPSNNKFKKNDLISIKLFIDISKGDLVDAQKKYLLLKKTKDLSLRTLRISILYNLFRRNFTSADRLFKLIRIKFKEFSKSTLFFMIGNEIYKFSKNIYGLHDIYREKLKNLKKNITKRARKEIRANEKLYKGKKTDAFQIISDSERVELNFADTGNDHINTIELKIKGKIFSIILDTGNTTGWMIHSRDLRELAKPRRGGRTVTRIGSESGNLDGFSIHCKSINFRNFKLKNVYGLYVPKPRSNFYDANLNPIFIKNRVTSLDFVNKKLILRTRERFEEDLKRKKNFQVIRSPWFGNRFPMIPVIISGYNGYAIIESGAEDISLKLKMARKAGLALIPKTKYLSNGKKFNYYLSPVEIQLGNYLFVRKRAEIWPFDRFTNKMNGFTADAVLGPDAFLKKFIISFLPGQNIIVFQYEKRKN